MGGIYYGNYMRITESKMPKFEVTSGASIMKEEIQKALKSMKDGKANRSR